MGGVSVQEGLCLGSLCQGVRRVSVGETPPQYGDKRVVHILLEIFIVRDNYFATVILIHCITNTCWNWLIPDSSCAVGGIFHTLV